jgi:hypothetical protein
MEALARLFVGIGFLVVAIILVWGLAAGFDQPYAWFKWAADSTGWPWMWPVYMALVLFVVPMGMLVFLRDIFGDPVRPWVKWALPGAFLAIFVFFLAVAMPDFGQPLFQSLEGLLGRSDDLPKPGTPGANQAWLVRFGVMFGVLAGILGVIGFVVGAMTGSKSGARRR